jgi:PAS domain S-box-containing protein
MTDPLFWSRLQLGSPITFHHLFPQVALGLAIRADAAREQLVADLRWAQAWYWGLFNGTVEALLVLAPDGSYLDANRAALELTGYRHDELRRMRVGDLSASPEDGRAAWPRIRDAGSWGGEGDLRCRDGSIVPVEIRLTSVPLDGGLVYVSSIRNIGERRAHEASHRDFIAMVGHELRNLIGAIQGSAGIMNVKGQFNERRGDRVLRQTRQLERLIADLLDAHQLESGCLELRLDRSDLTALVRACVDEAAALSSSHALRVDAPEGPLDGLWDADRVMQVVRNLLSNAIKYSPAGGEVLITLAASEHMVDVSVADRGAGIAPDDVPRLFDRFYRAPGTAGSVQGMGVGLYVCKQLVEAHGGTISVASQQGEGTTITFRIPRAGAAERK